MATSTRDKQYQEYLYMLGRQSKAAFWVEKEFGWKPISKTTNGTTREAWYQYLLLGACDNIYVYPEWHPVESLRGKPIRSFVWRIGRQSGKTELLSLSALYLAVKKPIKWTTLKDYKDSSLIGTKKADGTVNTTGFAKKEIEHIRGAQIIIASADADKARTVFDRVMKFIRLSTKFSAALDAGVIEMKMTPFPELKFHFPEWEQPAWITFRGPGAGGQTARSKTFDYKLYDEADYIPPIFFEAEKATGINAGENGLTILSSTPTGKRGYFYNACFIKDTKVNMADGTLKNIQDIEIGEEVFDKFGKPSKVIDVMQKYTHQKERIACFSTLKDDVIITSTSSHQFYSVKKDYTICPACKEVIFNFESKCSILGNHKNNLKKDLEYQPIRKLRNGDFLAISKNTLPNHDLNEFGYEDDEFFYYPIKDIKMFDIRTIVYNLNVEGDHSYCVNGFGVANCTNKELNFYEVHVPSKENPNYTKQFDRDFRNSLPEATYQHEILADWGTVEEGVFDWTYFDWVFRLNSSRPDPKNLLETIETPVYRIHQNKSSKKLFPDEYEKIKIDSDILKKVGGFNLKNWITSKIPPKEEGYTYWFGADLGYQADPSEFIVSKERNGINKIILRISMQHIEFANQADIIALLDSFYLFQALGLDVTGSGTGVSQELLNQNDGFNKYRNHHFEKRLFPVNFSGTVDILDKHTKQLRPVAAKQYMTDAIIMAAQNKMLQMPNGSIDEDLENQFRNHTYSVSDNGKIIYSKSNVFPDHAVDAIRTLYFAKSQLRKPKNTAHVVGSVFRTSGTGAWR